MNDHDLLLIIIDNNTIPSNSTIQFKEVIDESNVYHGTYFTYNLNWIPSSLENLTDESIMQLSICFLSELYLETTYTASSIEEYADICSKYFYEHENLDKSKSLTELFNYFKIQYNYVANSLDLLKRMFINYTNTVIKNISNSISFESFKRHMDSIEDNMEFFKLQRDKFLSIHTNGIFKSFPINSNLPFNYSLVDISNNDAVQIHSSKLFNRIQRIMINTIDSIYKLYLYLYLSHKVLKVIEVDNDLTKINFEVVLRL